MRLTIDEFLAHWVASGLVNREAAEAACAAHPAATTAADLARALVRAASLTKFQAQLILQGKGNSLTLGNYAILDRLGAGGMGQVFLAEHRRMQRRVALKVLAPALVKDRSAIERFHREVRAAARLTHPHIVAAFDADETRGVHYLVMEYVSGRDLATLVRDSGPLPVSTAVDCIVQAALGLQFAHEHGVIHRDIKPANLLLNADGVVKVLDMGLARIESIAGEQAALTGTGIIMGTVDYMAPEQAEDTRSADARSDIYSLGCTLHFLLTGRPVYAGETILKRILAHRQDAVPSLRAVRRDVPAEIDQVFRRMTAKPPADRYPSMADAIHALQRAQAGIPEPVATPAELLAGGDPSLGAFLAGLEFHDGTIPGGPSQTVGRGPSPSAPTIALGSADTDPQTLSRPSEPELSVRGGLRRRRHRTWNSPLAWSAAAGAAGVAALLLVLAGRPAPAPRTTGPVSGEPQSGRPVPAGEPAVVPADDTADAIGWALTRGAVIHAGNMVHPPVEVRSVAQWSETKPQVLMISFTAASGIGDDDLERLLVFPKLQSLSLSGCAVGDNGLKHIGRLPNLEVLDLTGTRVTDAGLGLLSQLRKLESLNLTRSAVAGRGLENLTGLRKLKFLGLDDLPIDDDSLRTLPGHPELYTLSLVRCTQLTDRCGAWLRHTPARAINLDGVPIGDECLQSLTGCRNLISLWLSGTRVSAAGVLALCRERPLNPLYLGDIAFTPEQMEELRAALPEAAIFSHHAVPPRASDVLGRIDLARDVIRGGWKKAGSLFTPEPVQGEIHLIRLPVDEFPEHYTIKMSIDRPTSERRGGLAVGFVVAGRRAALVIDDTDVPGWGLERVDGQSRTESGAMMDNAALGIGTGAWHAIDVTARVLQDGMVQVAGWRFNSPVFTWTGRPESLSLPEQLETPGWDGPFLAAWGRFGIHTIELLALDPTSAPGYRELNVPVVDAGWPDDESVGLPSADILSSPDWEWTPPANVGLRVNSLFGEYVPRVTGDGLILLYQSSKPNGQGSRIYENQRPQHNDLWRAARALPLTSEELPHVFHPSLSADALILVGTANAFGRQQLWISTRSDRNSEFSPPDLLGPAINSETWDTAFPVLSADGTQLWFASTRPGGLGGWDLWVSERADLDGDWEEAVHAGATINTPTDDHPAWLSDDGRVLLLSSAREGGVGAIDLWYATRNDTDTAWSLPVNLGAPVNTESNEYSAQLLGDGRTLLFDSERLAAQAAGEIWVSRRAPKRGTAAAEQFPALVSPEE